MSTESEKAGFDALIKAVDGMEFFEARSTHPQEWLLGLRQSAQNLKDGKEPPTEPWSVTLPE